MLTVEERRAPVRSRTQGTLRRLSFGPARSGLHVVKNDGPGDGTSDILARHTRPGQIAAHCFVNVANVFSTPSTPSSLSPSCGISDDGNEPSIVRLSGMVPRN